MEKENIKMNRKKVNSAIANYEIAKEKLGEEEIKGELIWFAEKVMIAQKELILSLQNELRNSSLGNKK